MGNGAFHPERRTGVVTDLHPRSDSSRGVLAGASHNLTATVIQFPNRQPETSQNFDQNDTEPRPRLWQRYNIHSFRAQDDPAAAHEVHQIHGESYLTAKYVTERALVNPYEPVYPGDALKDTSLIYVPGSPWDMLDTSRPTSAFEVEYHLGVPIDANKPEMGKGSVRLLTVHEGHSVYELPALEHSLPALSQGAKEKIDNQVVQHGVQSVHEVAALSLTDDAKNYDRRNGILAFNVSFELMRENLQRAIRNNTQELWVVNFAVPAHRQLNAAFGSLALQKAGDNVLAHPYDPGSPTNPRRSTSLELVPAFIEPCKALDQLLETIQTMRPYDSEFRTYSEYQMALELRKQGLRFMTDGLQDDELSDAVREFVHPTSEDPEPDKQVS